MIPIPLVHIGIGILLVLTSLPLALRWVPRNRAYGFRLRKSFVSDNNWYKINQLGGALFVAFGGLLVLFGSATWHSAPSPRTMWAPLFLAAPMLLLAPLLLIVKLVADHLPE